MTASVPRRFSLAVLATAAALALRPAYPEAGPKPHVAVLRVANQTGSAAYDAACRAATDTLVLTLRQLGTYQVVDSAGRSSGIGEERLRAMAAEEKLDFVVYGSMGAGSGGGIACGLSVYDRAKGRTSISRAAKAAGVLDIFAATDELVVAVLEAMTGSRIAFGSVELRNAGERGSYRVLVDGQEAGSDLASLEKVLIGPRRVTIVQRRMLGERQIAEARLEVREGASSLVEFSIPYLLEPEKARLDALLRRIEAGMEADDPSAAEAGVAELSSLVADVSYSPRLAAYRDRGRQLGGEAALRKCRRDIESSAWDPRLAPLEAAGRTYEDAATYPDPKRIRAAFEESARLLSALLELKAGTALAAGDLDGASKAFGDALAVSTRYLGSERMVDLAYATLVLRDLKERAGGREATAAGAEEVFGAWIRAAGRFTALRSRVQAGTARALVASDVSLPLSLDGGEYAEAPLALPPVGTPPRVRPRGSDRDAEAAQKYRKENK